MPSATYWVRYAYFERHRCPLARFGHSRDERGANPQIVCRLLTNAEGCPVAVEVFPGNTVDPKTVAAQVLKLRERLACGVVLVGDRGMLTSARIREDLQPVPGLEWITALRAPAIKKLASAGALQLSLFDRTDLAEITHQAFPGERLIACRGRPSPHPSRGGAKDRFERGPGGEIGEGAFVDLVADADGLAEEGGGAQSPSLDPIRPVAPVNTPRRVGALRITIVQADFPA